MYSSPVSYEYRSQISCIYHTIAATLVKTMSIYTYICIIYQRYNVVSDSEPNGGARLSPVQATGRREPLRRRQRPLFSSVPAGTSNQQQVAENLVLLSQRSDADVRRSDVRRRR